jgi:hypothetical protein
MLEPRSYIWQIHFFFPQNMATWGHFFPTKNMCMNHTTLCFVAIVWKFTKKEIKHVNNVCVQTIYLHLVNNMSPKFTWLSHLQSQIHWSKFPWISLQNEWNGQWVGPIFLATKHKRKWITIGIDGFGTFKHM